MCVVIELKASSTIQPQRERENPAEQQTVLYYQSNLISSRNSNVYKYSHSLDSTTDPIDHPICLGGWRLAEINSIPYCLTWTPNINLFALGHWLLSIKLWSIEYSFWHILLPISPIALLMPSVHNKAKSTNFLPETGRPTTTQDDRYNINAHTMYTRNSCLNDKRLPWMWHWRLHA